MGSSLALWLGRRNRLGTGKYLLQRSNGRERGKLAERNNEPRRSFIVSRFRLKPDRRDSQLSDFLHLVRRDLDTGATRVTTNAWPVRSSLELGALPTSVPCARLHTRHLLWEWGLDGLVEPAELLVSELVTNAVRAMAKQGNHTGRPPAAVR